MSNMSYCRFENTYHDLKDCANELLEQYDGAASPLSDDELRAAKWLVNLAADIVDVMRDQSGAMDLLDLGREERKRKIAEVLDRVTKDNAEAEKENEEAL